eukprot:6461588-Amphidinium_carterae.1
MAAHLQRPLGPASLFCAPSFCPFDCSFIARPKLAINSQAQKSIHFWSRTSSLGRSREREQLNVPTFVDMLEKKSRKHSSTAELAKIRASLAAFGDPDVMSCFNVARPALQPNPTCAALSHVVPSLLPTSGLTASDQQTVARQRVGWQESAGRHCNMATPCAARCALPRMLRLQCMTGLNGDKSGIVAHLCWCVLCTQDA